MTHEKTEQLDLTGYTAYDMLAAMQNAIVDASGKVGGNLDSIKQKIVHNPVKNMELALSIYFLIIAFATAIYSAQDVNTTILILVLGFSLAIFPSIIGLVLIRNKSRKLRNKYLKIIQTPVEIDSRILSIVYDRLEILVTIERKENINIEELCAIRHRYYKILQMMKELDDIDFLNPSEKTSLNINKDNL
jgi:hypothetical protein